MNRAGSSSINHCARDLHARFSSQATRRQRTGDGHLVLQSCQHALQLGRFAGENAARDLIGVPTIPYVQPPYVTCLDLGRSGAVFTRGWERTVELTGAE